MKYDLIRSRQMQFSVRDGECVMRWQTRWLLLFSSSAIRTYAVNATPRDEPPYITQVQPFTANKYNITITNSTTHMHGSHIIHIHIYSATIRRCHLWFAPLRVCSTNSRQQAPEWSVLGRVNCFSPWQSVAVKVLHQAHLLSLQWSHLQC